MAANRKDQEQEQKRMWRSSIALKLTRERAAALKRERDSMHGRKLSEDSTDVLRRLREGCVLHHEPVK